MRIKTMNQALTFNDDYIANNPDKCARIKRELVKINEQFETGKRGIVDKVSNHPVITVPFEYRPKFSRLARHGYAGRATGEYELVFNDCLPGKAWVEAHYQDTIPEPTIEITANGKSYKFNGDYKPGVVRQLVKSL